MKYSKPQDKPETPSQQGFSPINTAIIVGGLLAGLWIYTNNTKSSSPDKPQPVPVASSLDGVKQVLDAVEDRAKVKRIGDLFTAMGDVASRANPASTSVVRAWIVDSQTYMVQGTDLAGGIGLGSELNTVFSDAFGLEDRPLNQQEMKELSQLFNSIAELCNG